MLNYHILTPSGQYHKSNHSQKVFKKMLSDDTTMLFKRRWNRPDLESTVLYCLWSQWGVNDICLWSHRLCSLLLCLVWCVLYIAVAMPTPYSDCVEVWKMRACMALCVIGAAVLALQWAASAAEENALNREANISTDALLDVILSTTEAPLSPPTPLPTTISGKPTTFYIGFLAPWNATFDDFSALTSASALSIAIERVNRDPTLTNRINLT